MKFPLPRLRSALRGAIVAAACGSIAYAAAYTPTSTDFVKLWSHSQEFHNASFFAAVNTAQCGTAAPTIQGFGAAAAITAPNGNCSFQINVGTSNTGTGNVILPAATTAWHCVATDFTTVSTTVMDTKETSGSTTTKVVLQNYSDVAATHAWVDSDVVGITCDAY